MIVLYCGAKSAVCPIVALKRPRIEVAIEQSKSRLLLYPIANVHSQHLPQHLRDNGEPLYRGKGWWTAKSLWP